jgi:hypothetical protein
VDAPLPLPSTSRATLIATGIAAAEAVVIVVAAVALFGGKVVHHVRNAAVDHALAAPKRTLAAAPSHARLTRAQTSVLVLNGNGQAGAAETAAARVKDRGYTIGGVGNAPRSDYATTLVMYRPGLRGEALRLRHDLHGGVVTPLDGMRPRDLLGAHLVLVLGGAS